MQMKMQMKGIQFLLCLIVLHTVVGDFVRTSSWMTPQDKFNAVKFITICDGYNFSEGYLKAQCLSDFMTNVDADNQPWSCKHTSGNKGRRLAKHEKHFTHTTSKGGYSCSWTKPFCYDPPLISTDPRC